MGVNTNLLFNTKQGKYNSRGTSVRTQYAKNKNKFNVQYVHTVDKTFEEARIEQYYTQDATIQETFARIAENNTIVNIDYQHDITEKLSFLLKSNFNFYEEHINQPTKTDFFDENQTLSAYALSDQSSWNKRRAVNLGATIKHDTDKFKWVLRNNVLLYNIANNSDLSSTDYRLDGTVDYSNLYNHSPSKVKLWVSRLDNTIVLDSTAQMEFGLKWIFNDINTRNNFYNYEDLASHFDDSLSAHFKHREHIVSSYVQFAKEIKKINFVTGLRLELDYERNQQIDKNYEELRQDINVFPFINIAYELKKNHNWNFSYSRKISRPTFKDITPYIYFIDRYTSLQGNPDLESSISDNYEVQYIFKNSYIFGVTLNYKKNGIYRIPFQNEEDLTTILRPTNIESVCTWVFSNSSAWDVFKWWNINVNNLVFNTTVHSEADDYTLNENKWSFQTGFTNTVQLKDMKFQARLDYISPYISGSYQTANIFNVSASINKAFFDKNST